MESRTAYRTALVEYFNDHKAQLSEDSKTRLEVNPMRILDSKDEGDKKINVNAPFNTAYFTDAAKDFFASVKAGLDALGIAYTLNPHLVRGLDYYCHTVFEFTTDALGAQGTVLAGGRYDKLIEIMGGPDTRGSGWAAGMERLAMLVQNDAPRARPVAMIPLGEDAEKQALILTQALREAGVYVELGHRGNMGKRLKKADKQNAHAAVIIGEDEVKAGTVTLRKLDDGSQETIPQNALVEALKP